MLREYKLPNPEARREERKVDKFWMVYGGYGAHPTKVHNSFNDAKQEATRLALRQPGSAFTVLESIGYCVRSDVTWVQIPPVKIND